MSRTTPEVTVIMPVRNEAAHIEVSIDSVIDQDYPSDLLELIVIDGRSDDGTRERIAERLATLEKLGRHVRLIDNPERIVPVALNQGIRAAAGNVIIRVDGHCMIPKDYVTRCVRGLEATGAACVGGRIETVGTTAKAKGIAIAQSSRFGVGGVAFRTSSTTAGAVDTVPFGAYRREVFDRVGLFDESLVRNQDDEFNYRLNRAGEVVWLDPAICTTYFSRTTLRGLFKQYFEYGVYKVRVVQKVGLASYRHVVPAVFVSSLVGGSIATALTRWWGFIAVPAGTYVATNIAFSVASAKRSLRSAVFVPLAYFTLHVSYGLGSLVGLWRWRRTWGRSETAPLS